MGFLGRLLEVQRDTFARQRIEYSLSNPGQGRLAHHVPHQQFVVGLNCRVIVIVHAHSTFQPPIRRVQRVCVMRTGEPDTPGLDLCPQFVGLVDPDVATLVGVIGIGQHPADLLRQPPGHRDRQRAARPQDPDEFGDRTAVVRDVFEDFGGNHDVESAVRIGKSQGVAYDYLGLG